MTTQAPKLLNVLLCDEVRQERNGKLIVIGMYLDNIGVPELPFTMSSLTFLCKWKVLGGVLPTGIFTVVYPSAKLQPSIVVQPEGAVPNAEGVLLTMLAFNHFKLTEPGQYRLQFKPEDGRARTIYRFQIDIRDTATQCGNAG